MKISIVNRVLSGNFPMPQLTKVNNIRNINDFEANSSKSSTNSKSTDFSTHLNKAIDTIDISEAGKLYAEKVKQTQFQYGSKIISKSDVESPILERTSPQNIYQNVAKRKIDKADFKKWSAAEYVENTKSGFTISGLNIESYNFVEPSAKDIIRNYYENEFIKEPGRLVNLSL